MMIMPENEDMEMAKKEEETGGIEWKSGFKFDYLRICLNVELFFT